MKRFENGFDSYKKAIEGIRPYSCKRAVLFPEQKNLFGHD